VGFFRWVVFWVHTRVSEPTHVCCELLHFCTFAYFQYSPNYYAVCHICNFTLKFQLCAVFVCNIVTDFADKYGDFYRCIPVNIVHHLV